MKNKVGLIIAVLMLLFGAYALSIALSTSGAHIILMSNHEIPRELVLMFGFICLGGRVVITMSALSKKNSRMVNE
jgi:hypothetical protein